MESNKMEIDINKIINSIQCLKKQLNFNDNKLEEYLRLQNFEKQHIDNLYVYLSTKILDFYYTIPIANCFESTILIIINKALHLKTVCSKDLNDHRIECIALSKLIKTTPNLMSHILKYFIEKPPPFPDNESKLSKKKSKISVKENLNLEILKCCHRLLCVNPIFFIDLWDWSPIFNLKINNDFQLQFYHNQIIGILTKMSQVQINELMCKIPEMDYLKYSDEINFESTSIEESFNDEIQGKTILWDYKCNEILNIEGILLPVFNEKNANYFANINHKIVNVGSSKLNLQNIALGISYGKAICLNGPVGCGKTSLVEYLAKITGRIFPNQIEKFTEIQNIDLDEEMNNFNDSSIKRKWKEDNSNTINLENDLKSVGFLRIQLGDQIDSKTLLGQYTCTDIPGEFIWTPGVLTQAVSNGYWLLLEDIDAATTDTLEVLNNLLENKVLNVAGYDDCLTVKPGFQLFVTSRSNLSGQQKNLLLLEKHLHTIQMHPLSAKELSKIIDKNYPKLKTISNRIVDVFLGFSKTNHTDYFQRLLEENCSDNINSNLPLDSTSLKEFRNSNRCVSTRDLMKLCHRSVPKFSATSAECAYFIFQNAVDVFCSYLPANLEKTKLIVDIGSKLGIIPSRCEFFANEYKPDIKITSDEIKVGRINLKTKSKRYQAENTSNIPEKKKKLNNNKEIHTISTTSKTAMFSFTRISSCILERIAVCIDENEPVLLVGETGVGKTSSVQYLAEKTQHKLVVVNMNNQSDVSDLVGGFKPVDLNFILAPLRTEFESIFKQTFNVTKNEKFLSHISICYNQGNFAILVKLMLKIIKTVFEKAEENLLKIKNEIEMLKKWKFLEMKLIKLDSQLKKSLNISFAFIPGSLVKCMKNGDWLLLDEINLATSETLECLSTILEPEGSIVLLEKGDLTPVKRHPNFRIFACMNPNTDIGKKDLPIGIRNRFTEFFVDELIDEKDLFLLVNDYLENTGIKKTKVLNIVRLYKKLKSLSEIELNDGLGNRPVFSLRTLCRSLAICSKNLCGSVERNLYESFCLSFLTQLDINSHKIVLDLIQTSLLTNVKAILAQTIPKPGNDYINFEGFWIEIGTNEIQNCETYILTESVKENLRDLSRIASIGKLPVLLQGPTSAGKTSLIEFLARSSGNHCLRINNHEHTDLQEYIGTYVSDSEGKLSFKEGVLVQAMRNGFWIILDELNLASTDILEALNRVLDDNRELFIPETQATIKAHPNFMLFATQNPPGLYGGRKTLSRAFKNRFIELHFSEIPKPELEIILEKRCLIPKSYAKKMVNCLTELQMNRKSTTKNNFTLRDLFRWGNRYTYADNKLLENNLYDWNQHLVDEGYLVLSAKVRNQIEIEIIEEALFKYFRKKISDLFNIKDMNSMVTKNILKSISEFQLRNDIVWTKNTTRMAILTAKALEFNEPILLIGPTGCGKTTICQILAQVSNRPLHILNCHMHTEGADFLGGLRPCRNSENKSKQLFEWVDGPLVISMQEGCYFMADEISLAEDSVLERLNCVLEPERTLLLAEKGGTDTKLSKDFVIKAKNEFKFLATMNPGGDFGKKELSPALRNRFTEIWCSPPETREDLIDIASNFLKDIKQNREIATVLINIMFSSKEFNEKIKFSIRDILAWTNYILENLNNKKLSLAQNIIYGFETMFLDSLEMLPFESLEQIEFIRNNILQLGLKEINKKLGLNAKELDIKQKFENPVEFVNNEFGIKPFFVKIIPELQNVDRTFLFNVPTTKINLFRILSALSLKKAILLEGSPGIGKTAIIENLAKVIGYKIVRINLCEHTDLTDLFGTDLPAESNPLDENAIIGDADKIGQLGVFQWRDGPLLAALKSPNTWILLDELNLAPQSVLEGLNAILDHRGEIYIPELNKTFYLNIHSRIFACQNPLRQGGGRKGLPQSFLNRFTKVYLKKLQTRDMLQIVNESFDFNQIYKNFDKYFNYVKLKDCSNSPEVLSLFDISNFKCDMNINLEAPKINIKFNLADKMVKFSETLQNGITNFEFGSRGGPYDINLRDILRWCYSLFHEETGFTSLNYTNDDDLIEILFKELDNLLLTLYDKMKLIYYNRMVTEQDKKFIRQVFGDIFNCNVEKLNRLSENIGLYWTDSQIYMNDITLNRTENYQKLKAGSLLLSSQREMLKNLTECVIIKTPVILNGPSNSGKTKIIDTLCALSNQICNYDYIDDSVTGSFQQVDLNRYLNEIAQHIEIILTKTLQDLIINNCSKNLDHIKSLFKYWNSYVLSKQSKTSDLQLKKLSIVSNEIINFRDLIMKLNKIIDELLSIKATDEEKNLKNYKIVLSSLKNFIKNSESLNTGGHFEWVDSKIVKSLKKGQFICLEHVNLCSSAVLDRLNPLFETNGNLLMSEKGVSINNEFEIVNKHENFRSFLTMDPSNGDLSRAMRNRCVEISISKDIYTKDDYRSILYYNGIKSISLINCMIRIHQRLRQVSELSNFNVSHIVKYGFLVTGYKKIGLSPKKAIYAAGLEVYVYPSRTDLLGLGLHYYHEKLINIIEEELALFKESSNICFMENLYLTCNNLNKISMIKLQIEPIKCILQSLLDNINEKNFERKVNMHLLQYFEKFENFNFKNDYEFLKYFIYMLYETSTYNDLQMRMQLIDQILKTSSLQEHYTKDAISFNKRLYEIIENNRNCFNENSSQLLWNTKLFPRIKNGANTNVQIQYKNSALMITELTLEPITDNKTDSLKLSQISALTYSRASESGTISDAVNNILLKFLYKFLYSLKIELTSTIQNSKLSLKILYDFMISLKFYNRILHISKNKLFINKSLNESVIGSLNLHMNWLNKNLLKFCEEIEPSKLYKNKNFEESLNNIRNYLLTIKHPLNMIQRKYCKNMIKFDPIYLEDQIKLFNFKMIYDELTGLVPYYGNYKNDILKKKMLILLSQHSKDIKIILCKNDLKILKEKICGQNLDCTHEEESVINYEYLEETKISFNEILNQDLCEIPVTEVEILALKEYFIEKYLINSEFANLNSKFYENISTLSSSTLLLLEMLNTDDIKIFFQNYLDFLDSIALYNETFSNNAVENDYKNRSTCFRIILNLIQNYLLARQYSNAYLKLTEENYELECEASYNGPSLTNIFSEIFFNNDGLFKEISLKNLNLRTDQLMNINNILWNNICSNKTQGDIMQTNCKFYMNYSRKLLNEIHFIKTTQCSGAENNSSDFTNNFNTLISKLSAIDISLENESNDIIQIEEYDSKLGYLSSLIGAVELSIYSYSPVVDPVEKKRLKDQYLEEDIDSLTTLTDTYNFMRIILNYEDFGEEIYETLNQKMETLLSQQKKEEYNRLALRPEKCLYINFVNDLKHFLKTNCSPDYLLNLIEKVEVSMKTNIKSNIVESIKILSVWIINAQRFTHHTLRNYTYYQDFIQPIKCAVTMIIYGFEHLKANLKRLDALLIPKLNSVININENGKLTLFLENLIQFPSFKIDTNFKSFLRINDNMFFKFAKVKLNEIENRLIISTQIDNSIFFELDKTLKDINNLWQDAEEIRMKQLAEENSLYVQKVRCETEDEYELEMMEIQDKFPTYIEEDFGNFVDEDLQEKINKNQNPKKIQTLFNGPDYKLIGEYFIRLMECYSKNYYYIGGRSINNCNFSDQFTERIQIFISLYQHYKCGINKWLDEKVFNPFIFFIGLQQNALDPQENSNKNYNFYKDSNLVEVSGCGGVLNEIECKALEQLELYPDHASLNDITLVINRIRNLPATGSIVRFNTGFQILRQKLAQWNEVAHKKNNMVNLEIRVAEYVQQWTRLELQFWRNCLSQSEENVENNAYKYWFYIYNLLHEYLHGVNSKYKLFEDLENNLNEDGNAIESSDVLKTLQQFVESSNYGDFNIRMNLLKSFELYLNLISDYDASKVEELISILHHLRVYYNQFTNQIANHKKSIRTPIEKKMKEFVKIESYNKDLSYFSMRNNVAKVHRNLNKFCKEYESQLKVKISDVFTIKDGENNTNEGYDLRIRNESVTKYYIMDVRTFVAKKGNESNEDLFSLENINISNDNSLFNRLKNFIKISRNISKQFISNIKLPSYIQSLDQLLTEQIETCDYLRKLEVDRSVERPKQIVHAKSILQQKRKGLSDLFKILSNIGLNFKTGLMEQSTNSNITDIIIKPFCIQTMYIRKSKLKKNLLSLNENLNDYYAKCILKLKQLQNVMLQPQSELGLPNIDRIKGFSTDLFLLVQNQRKLLSQSINDNYYLNKIIINIESLSKTLQTNELEEDKINYVKLQEEFNWLKKSFNKIQYIFEQFNILIKNVPASNDETQTVLSKSISLCKSSENYHKVVEMCNNILSICKRTLTDLNYFNDAQFLCFTKIQEFKKVKLNVIEKINTIINEFENNNSSPACRSLYELINELELQPKLTNGMSTSIELEKIEIEINNILHGMLLSIEKLYKKYTKFDQSIQQTDVDTSTDEIIKDHLKQKIVKEISNDLHTLNAQLVHEKLTRLLTAIKYEENFQIKIDSIKKCVAILPILDQFSLISDYYILQQMGSHKLTSKMLSVMLTVFIELGSKGFCVPGDLMQDEEGKAKNEKKGSGFGLEDGTGENDVSDKIENEDQLDDAKRPEDRKNDEKQDKNDCKEEKGIDVSEDFDGDLHDLDKPEDDEEDKNSDDEDDLDKEMGDTDKNNEKLDGQIWGSDAEEDEQDDDQLNEEENGGDNVKDDNDQHNDLDSKNDSKLNENNETNETENLDATDADNEKEKKSKNDIDKIDEKETDEDQVNPYHNELEEPPEPQDMNLEDNFNLDQDADKDNADENNENPFDIDTMKDQMDCNEDLEGDENDAGSEKGDLENDMDTESEAESEPEVGSNQKDKSDDENEINPNEEIDEKENDFNMNKEEIENNEEEKIEEPQPENEKPEENTNNELSKTNENKTLEDNVESAPEEKNVSSIDQTENTNIEQENNLDEQDTGEDKDGKGQASNDQKEKGHEGIAESKDLNMNNQDQNQQKKQEKKKPGETNEDRTLDESTKSKKQNLKTVEKVKETIENMDVEEDKTETNEHQHVKEAKQNDKTTTDTATEEQSKNIQHLEDEDNEMSNENDNEDINETDLPSDKEEKFESTEELDKLVSEANNEKKNEKSTKNDKTNEVCEASEKIDIEGELIDTYNIQRGAETTANCRMDIIKDSTIPEEMSNTELLEFHKNYQDQVTKKKLIIPGNEDYQSWQEVFNCMTSSARELCEQLRLILEPTKCTRLKGDYRTGRRLNMKKIIPYIASQFRKDKIWLRRTKPAQRDYKITIAIDDSKSMHHNNSKILTLKAISLVSQALTLLESGKLSIVSFGESTQILSNFSEQFNGPKLIKSLNFDQNKSRIAELLDFIRIVSSQENGSSDNGIFENLLLILSDGRNIFSEGEQKVKNAIKLARLQRIFLVYIIIDNPENKHSILDIRVPNFSVDRKSISMKSYLDMFPFPYYIIVRDLLQLPIVLSEAMRQWFELVNSEQ